MSRAAAFFDLDGTLLARGSAERWFMSRALRGRALTPPRVAAGLLQAVGLWLTGRVRTPGECKAYLAGRDCEPLVSLGVECVHEDVVPRLRPGLLRELEVHRAAGRAIVLLSGAPDFLLDELARFLHADAHVASRLERDAGRFTGRVLPPYPYADGKRRALLDLSQRLDLDLAASHAYANHASDVAHLELVGHPCAVAPDAGLRRAARWRGWRTWEEPHGSSGPERQGTRG